MTEETQGNGRSMRRHNLAMSQEGVVENWFIVVQVALFYMYTVCDSESS